jgi:predicted RNA-binding protein YlqC (UPF0109 family)
MAKDHNERVTIAILKFVEAIVSRPADVVVTMEPKIGLVEFDVSVHEDDEDRLTPRVCGAIVTLTRAACQGKCYVRFPADPE